jgi:hypothetical protein
MIYDYMPLSYRLAANMDAVLYGIRTQYAYPLCEPETIWGEFCDEIYRRGGDDMGDSPEWMA